MLEMTRRTGGPRQRSGVDDLCHRLVISGIKLTRSSLDSSNNTVLQLPSPEHSTVHAHFLQTSNVISWATRHRTLLALVQNITQKRRLLEQKPFIWRRYSNSPDDVILKLHSKSPSTTIQAAHAMSGKYTFTKALKEVRFHLCQTSDHSAATRSVGCSKHKSIFPGTSIP